MNMIHEQRFRVLQDACSAIKAVSWCFSGNGTTDVINKGVFQIRGGNFKLAVAINWKVYCYISQMLSDGSLPFGLWKLVLFS